MASIGDVLKRTAGSFEDLPERACAGGCGTMVRARWCKPCADAADAADERGAAATELAPALESVPTSWRWAHLGSPLLASRVSGASVALAAIERRVPWPEGVTLYGAGGRGKTSLAVAIFHAWITRPQIAVDLRRGARFVSARLLPLAKGDHARGSGGSEYMGSIGSPFVVLDDLGSEGDMPHARAAVADVLAERFAWDRPTIVTTFLEEPAIRQRYGDGVARRMFERALVLNLGGLS